MAPAGDVPTIWPGIEAGMSPCLVAMPHSLFPSLSLSLSLSFSLSLSTRRAHTHTHTVLSGRTYTYVRLAVPEDGLMSTRAFSPLTSSRGGKLESKQTGVSRVTA